ncbi:hypothetical protein QYF61_000180 [Mycteria americana]|uniref:Uncharacterized protein n=1 Tax=Mycteria americana TaxID=33587 RepID=A0AAN7NQM9_MYCAM|nr:hypothetical protein QYF61_000180 [Mycteria americana]
MMGLELLPCKGRLWDWGWPSVGARAQGAQQVFLPVSALGALGLFRLGKLGPGKEQVKILAERNILEVGEEIRELSGDECRGIPSILREVFQPSDHFCGPPLDLLQQVHVFLVLGMPELDAILQDVNILFKLWGPELDTVLKGWRLNHFPGQPVPMLENPFREVKFPNIQSKPPLVQLEAIFSRPITCYLGEQIDPHLATTSFQVVVESNKVSPQPPFLQAEQPQFPQPLFIRLVLQTLHQLRCPSLDTLQHLNVSLVVRGPKLNTVFQVRPHQCQVQGHDHFPSPAGHTIFDTNQDAIGFLGHLGTLLAHIQAAVNQHPQVLLCWAAFQPLFPKPVALHGVVVTQVQDLALGLVKPHTIGPSPSIQPVQVPLQSLPPLKQINTPAQLGVIFKLAQGALGPLVQIIDTEPCETLLAQSNRLQAAGSLRQSKLTNPTFCKSNF